MELEGKIFKNGRWWLIEVPSLNLMTQGKTKKEALEMIVDAAFGLAECYFETEMEKGFSVEATEHEKGVIGLSATNNELLFALSSRRQRENSGQCS